MRKAQLKMTENIMIMFIFFVLVALAFIFYGKLTRQGTAADIEKYTALENVKLAQIASFLPELRCSEDNSPKPNCIDLQRVEKAKAVFTDKKSYYFGILSYSNITIHPVYPPVSQPGSTIAVYSNEPDWKEKSYSPLFIPISLYNPLKDTYGFGVLEVGSYDKII